MRPKSAAVLHCSTFFSFASYTAHTSQVLNLPENPKAFFNYLLPPLAATVRANAKGKKRPAVKPVSTDRKDKKSKLRDKIGKAPQRHWLWYSEFLFDSGMLAFIGLGQKSKGFGLSEPAKTADKKNIL